MIMRQAPMQRYQQPQPQVAVRQTDPWHTFAVKSAPSSVVRIVFHNPTNPNRAGLASGVVMEDGSILSAAHGLTGATRIRVYYGNFKYSPAKVVKRHPGVDMVTLSVTKIPKRGVLRARLAAKRPRKGDKVYIAGFGSDGRLREATGPYVAHASSGLYQVSGVAARGGDSGGGLFNRNDELVGIISTSTSDHGAVGGSHGTSGPNLDTIAKALGRKIPTIDPLMLAQKTKSVLKPTAAVVLKQPKKKKHTMEETLAMILVHMKSINAKQVKFDAELTKLRDTIRGNSGIAIYAKPTLSVMK